MRGSYQPGVNIVVRLEVIEFFDPTNRSIIARYPANGSADIQWGAQLIVQQNQEAVFFRDGRAMDQFGPGRHTLTTANVPIITRILTVPWEKSPFRALVYFVGKQTFIDQKWGTRQPIAFRDQELGVVRLRGFGKYSFRVVDSSVLINTLVGTQNVYTTAEVSSFLRDLIVARLTDLLGTMQLNLFDLPSRFDEIASAARLKVADEFSRFGLEIVDFFINAITPPEEVQQAIDARSSMKTIGDLRGYTMYQAANSMRKMAEQSGQGGGAAAGVGLGVGAGMGMMLPGFLQRAMTADASTAPGPLSIDDLKAVPSDPRHLVRQVAQAAGWQLTEQNEKWQLTIPVQSTRRQIVDVDFDRQDGEGHPLISFRSGCGPATEENAMALLRMNRNLAHGAFAIEPSPSGDMVVMQSNQLADTADALEITRAVTAIAWQADTAEQQLLGQDNL